MEEGEERGEDPKEEGEGDEGKEREEKDDSDQTPADSILGSSCHALIFPFSPLGARPPCFGVLFSLHHGSHCGGNTWGRSLFPFVLPIYFIPSCLDKNGMKSIPPCSVGKKKAFCSLRSAGSWRVPGPCVVQHRILPGPLLSLHTGLRDHTASL